MSSGEMSTGLALNLKSNELIHPGLEVLLENGLRRMQPAALSRYPRPGRILELLADYHGVAPGTLALAGGSDVAIRMLADVLGRERGRLVLQAPNYEAWEAQARRLRLDVVRVAFGSPLPDAFCVERLLDALDSGSPAVVAISNPNGPTGWCMSEADVVRVADAARQRGHVLVLDECYGAFAGLEHARLLDVRERVVIVHSYSKTLGMAGARLAAVIASAQMLAQLEPWLPEGTVSAPALALVEHLVACHREFAEIWRDIRDSREWFSAAVAQLGCGWSALPSGGNFVNVRVGDPRRAAALHLRLLDAGIRTRSMNGLAGLDGCVRFTIADRPTMSRVLTVVREVEED